VTGFHANRRGRGGPEGAAVRVLVARVALVEGDAVNGARLTSCHCRRWHSGGHFLVSAGQSELAAAWSKRRRSFVKLAAFAVGPVVPYSSWQPKHSRV
jgi:hypothetical protein